MGCPLPATFSLHERRGCDHKFRLACVNYVSPFPSTRGGVGAANRRRAPRAEAPAPRVRVRVKRQRRAGLGLGLGLRLGLGWMGRRPTSESRHVKAAMRTECQAKPHSKLARRPPWPPPGNQTQMGPANRRATSSPPCRPRACAPSVAATIVAPARRANCSGGKLHSGGSAVGSLHSTAGTPSGLAPRRRNS